MAEQETRETRSTNYQKYEALLRQLHDLDKVGKLDSDEANKIREDMEEPWEALSRDEQQTLDELSESLYSD